METESQVMLEYSIDIFSYSFCICKGIRWTTGHYMNCAKQQVPAKHALGGKQIDINTFIT